MRDNCNPNQTLIREVAVVEILRGQPVEAVRLVICQQGALPIVCATRDAVLRIYAWKNNHISIVVLMAS